MQITFTNTRMHTHTPRLKSINFRPCVYISNHRIRIIHRRVEDAWTFLHLNNIGWDNFRGARFRGKLQHLVNICQHGRDGIPHVHRCSVAAYIICFRINKQSSQLLDQEWMKKASNNSIKQRHWNNVNVKCSWSTCQEFHTERNKDVAVFPSLFPLHKQDINEQVIIFHNISNEDNSLIHRYFSSFRFLYSDGKRMDYNRFSLFSNVSMMNFYIFNRYSRFFYKNSKNVWQKSFFFPTSSEIYLPVDQI